MIICIYGDYGVGKDTFADMLVQTYKDFYPNEKNLVKKIKSYTTRKPRYEGENTHIFVSKEEWGQLTDFVAKTEINNEFYGATLEQFNAEYNIYVVNEEGLEQILASKNHSFISKKMGKLCIIKITRPFDLINVQQNRLTREKKVSKYPEFLEENTHIEIDNNGTMERLRNIAEVLPIILPYFKLIE